jgi:hypothetical protein
VTVLALTAGALIAPVALAPLSDAHATVGEFDPAEVSAWLLTPHVVRNPPAPSPGLAVAPPVSKGFLITGNALPRYDVTATALAQQEIQAFVGRTAHHYGLRLDPAQFRVYATPHITARPDRAANANLAELVRSITSADDARNVPTVQFQSLLDVVLKLRDRQTAPADTEPLVTATRTALDAMQPMSRKADAEALASIAQLLTGALPNPSSTAAGVYAALDVYDGRDLAGTVEAIQQTVAGFDALTKVQDALTVADPALAEVRAALDTIGPLPDPAPVLAELAAIVSKVDVDALLATAGMPTADEIVSDPSHAPPAGEDAAVDAYGGVLGDVTVLPYGTDVSAVGAAFDDGIYKVETTLRTTPLEGTTGPAAGLIAGDLQQSGKGDWSQAGGIGCFGQKNSASWYDPCSWWWTLAKDGNPDRWTYDLQQWGTAKGKGKQRLHHFEALSWRKKGTPDQDWLDWGPRSDTERDPCHTDAVGFSASYQGAGASFEDWRTHCEEWDIDHDFGKVLHGNTWRGLVKGHEREVGMNSATSTPNGYTPTDYVRFGYDTAGT